MSDLTELLARIRQLSQSVPALADILSQMDSPQRQKGNRPKRGEKPLRIGRARPDMPATFYAPRIEREPSPILTKRERQQRADRYRARIDAIAEAEGEAIERLEHIRSAGMDLLERAMQWSTIDDRAAHRLICRFNAGRTGNALSHLDYVRALAAALPLDTTERVRRGRMSLVLRRYDYRRQAAQRAWRKVCEYYARRTQGEILPPPAFLSRLPGWARQTQENAQTRARRQLQKQWRELVRIIGKAKIAGIAGADELYAQVSTMQPLA